MNNLGLINLADASISDLQENNILIRKWKGQKNAKINVATWFLPIVTHALKGGVRTVFIFSEMMSIKWGTLNIFVIYSHSGKDFDASLLENSLRDNFPRLNFLIRKLLRGQNHPEELPHSDIAFCTLWTTAYQLLKYNKTKKKFYFMQDYEPLFYEAGSVYAVIEQTYRFGFSCIANTSGVGNKYLSYSNDVVSFNPGVDFDVFFAREEVKIKKDFLVVFYGRPNNPRNCFSLGVSILKALKRKMKDRVRIVSVGAEWEVGEYGLQGVVENLGLLQSLDDVANLYRDADLGLVFMVTPHPSYQPLEYMSCGCVVATNINESNEWLLNKNNSLLLEPIPEIAAEKICSTLTDKVKMENFRINAYKSIKKYRWSDAFSIFEERVLS